MLLKLSVCKGLKLYIDGTEVKEQYLELSQGKHLVRLEQDHPLYKRDWIKALLNPFSFFGSAFFRSEHTLYKSYNSQAAVWEGEIELHRDAKLSADLKLCHFDGNFLQEYWDIDIKAKDLTLLSGKKVAPHWVFRRRWIILRVFPCLVMGLVFWAVGISLRKTLVIPLVYSALVLIRGICLFRNKPILRQ